MKIYGFFLDDNQLQHDDFDRSGVSQVPSATRFSGHCTRGVTNRLVSESFNLGPTSLYYE
jgi:hypothetical protein